MGDRTEYQKKYYKKNRKARLRYKKDKYENDEDYRNGILKARKVQLALGSLVAHDTKPKMVVHNGNEETRYSLALMAPVVHRTLETLMRWRTEEVLPKSLYKTKAGSFYSHSQVMYLSFLIKIIDTYRLPLSSERMAELLRKVWKKTFTANEAKKLLTEVTGNASEKEKGGEDSKSKRKPKRKQG